MIKHLKSLTARMAPLQASLINNSGTGLNIKNLPLLTKFRTRSVRITNSRSHKHSIIGSRRESWSPRHWSVSDVSGLAILCNKPAYLALVYPNLPGYYILCMANLPHTDYAPTALILHDVFYKLEIFVHEGTPRKV